MLMPVTLLDSWVMKALPNSAANTAAYLERRLSGMSGACGCRNASCTKAARIDMPVSAHTSCGSLISAQRTDPEIASFDFAGTQAFQRFVRQCSADCHIGACSENVD